MFDLYLVVTPVLGLVAIITLINLKLTLKEPQFDDLKHYVRKIDNKNPREPQKQSSSDSLQSQRQFIKTLFYLIKNYTFIDFILIRRARNKIPILLSLSIQMTLIYYFGFSFYFSALGILINLLFLTVKLIAQYLNENSKRQEDNQSKTLKLQVKNGRKLQIIMSTLSLLLNMALIWIFYQNFNNQLLMSTCINIGIIFAIDNFAIKPLIFALFSFPLSFSTNVNHFIDLENQIVQVLHKSKILKTSKKIKDQVKNPQKIFISTSHTENTLQIEPYVNLDPHQNVLQVIKPSRKVQLEKIPNIRKRPSKQYNGDNSSLSLFESHLPIKQQNLTVKNQQNFKSSQKNYASPQIKQKIQQLNNSSFLKKKTRIYSKNVDLIDQQKINSKQIQKVRHSENEDMMNNSNIRTPKSRKFLKEIKFTNSAMKNFEINKSNDNNLNKSYEKDLIENLAKTQQMKNQNRSNHSYESNFYGSGGKNDLLKIYEDKLAQDLGQIDVNSPYRRRKPFQIKLDDVNSKSNQTKNNKKFSLNASKSIVQQLNTSQFPDYLQKTYVEQSHEKKRRSFHQVTNLNMSRKSDVFSKYSNESRISKSFKRTIRSKDPIVRQNDENRIPEFVIEDFTYY